jgi:hypothetical protein
MNTTTILRPRLNTPPIPSQNPIADFGVPGVPFVEPVPSTPVYSQGEDIIYDAVLAVDGHIVTPDKWNIEVIVKTNQFTIGDVWLGVLENGLYYNTPEVAYQIWIPSSLTSNIAAGTYMLDVKATEKIGVGKGIKDRTVVLASTYFAIEYTASSPHPDSTSSLPGRFDRATLEHSYPPYDSPLGFQTTPSC